MNRISISFCLLAAAVFAFSSCKEDKVDGVMLTAHLEQAGNTASKAHLVQVDNTTYDFQLVTGDSAYVNNGIFAFDFENGNPILKVNHSSNNVYRAIFPASIVDTNANPDITNSNETRVIIPRNQRYRSEAGVQKVDMPMISYPEGYSLWFKNICGLIEVRVTNNRQSAVNLQAIEVSNNIEGQADSAIVYLSGNTRVNTTASEPTIDVTADSYRYVRLDFNGENARYLSPGQSRSYYLIVAPFSTTNVNIRVYTAGNNFRNLPLSGVSLQRNQIARVNFNLAD